MVLRVLGVGGQVPQRGADGAPGGVDTGDQRQGGDTEHHGVLDRLAVDLGLEQLAQQVVARVPSCAALDLGDEVLDEGHRCRR